MRLQNVHNFALVWLSFMYINFSYVQDRRCTFYDVSKKPKELRKATTNILIFYSSYDNIGNRLPVLGIAKMLEIPVPDTWCVHDASIDFDFINKNYKCVIVAGGLLGKSFEPFWRQVLQCNVPIILWGQGGLFPDNEGTHVGVNKSLIKEVAKKFSLVNIRDVFTKEHYGFHNAHIAHCPSIVYLKDFRKYVAKKPTYTIFVTHNQNVAYEETEAIIKIIKKYVDNPIVINNYQSYEMGLDDILLKQYCNAKLIISSKLHAGVMAYSLGIPYIMFARDEKQRAFQKEHLNGMCVNSLDELEKALRSAGTIDMTHTIKTESIVEFGKQAKAFIDKL